LRLVAGLCALGGVLLAPILHRLYRSRPSPPRRAEGTERKSKTRPGARRKASGANGKLE
jgi:hypothetical protein